MKFSYEYIGTVLQYLEEHLTVSRRPQTEYALEYGISHIFIDSKNYVR